jgi:tetratricopeptide (TPR) repeat protein
MYSKFFVALVMVTLLSASANAQQTARNQRKEQLTVEELANIAPKAVETFKRATDAMDKKDYKQAIQLYREVTMQAPTFTPALRRLGLSLAASGQSDQGLFVLETAVGYERSPENLAGLAEVLANPNPGEEGTPDQMSKALGLAAEAFRKYKTADDPGYSVWELFANREAITQQMNSEIERMVHSAAA